MKKKKKSLLSQALRKLMNKDDTLNPHTIGLHQQLKFYFQVHETFLPNGCGRRLKILWRLLYNIGKHYPGCDYPQSMAFHRPHASPKIFSENKGGGKRREGTVHCVGTRVGGASVLSTIFAVA